MAHGLLHEPRQKGTGEMVSFGLFFEDFAVRDLSVYASVLGGSVSIIGTIPA
jgi:hypothetical protein